jgi:SAM-dependent methyltransferase
MGKKRNKGDSGFRENYIDGVEAYYKENGSTYQNPHEDRVWGAIRSMWHHTSKTYRVLDLACGSGEATRALMAIGIRDIRGCDPYTYSNYYRRTGKPCDRLSFEDIANGNLLVDKFDLIVCSYALHLVRPSRLPSLLFNLTLMSPRLLVISPIKRPGPELPHWSRIERGKHDRTHVSFFCASEPVEAHWP